jgi:hypothetical protein
MLIICRASTVCCTAHTLPVQHAHQPSAAAATAECVPLCRRHSHCTLRPLSALRAASAVRERVLESTVESYCVSTRTTTAGRVRNTPRDADGTTAEIAHGD